MKFVSLISYVVFGTNRGRNAKRTVAVSRTSVRTAARPRPAPQPATLTGKAYVIDGDTIVVRKTKIRLAGIDAPELDMPWGQKSKWAMVAICRGHVITVELNGERSHDRLVGTAYLPDGRDIGAELVRQGLALDLPYYSGGRYRNLEPPGARRRLGNGRFGHRSIDRR